MYLTGDSEPLMSKTNLMHVTTRRVLLSMLGAAATAPIIPGKLFAQDGGQDPIPSSSPFSFDLLSEAMRKRAENPDPGPLQLPLAIPDLDYDGFRNIAYNPDRSRWNEDGQQFHIQAFHRGWLFSDPVSLYDISDGTAQPMQFTAADFEYREHLEGTIDPSTKLPGIAGWRMTTPLNSLDVYDELVAFLGASYFRALGRGNQYGASARGLAIDTATSRKEEFPRFSAFYLEKPVAGTDTVRVYATLDSARVTGAYRFVITPGAPTDMIITARLYFREDVEELGVAPLTSMFFYDETTPGRFRDFRPQVHDSQGLGILRADGSRLWRQLSNPPQLAGSWYHMDEPATFGLYQRDRAFEEYLDAESRYEQRPSMEVEPLGDWGPGHVRLVEIPADLERYDNIVAYWRPDEGPKAGEEREYTYRLSWGDMDAEDRRLAHVVRTSSGIPGVAGVEQDGDGRKFVIDFEGDRLSRLAADADVEAIVKVTNGTTDHVSLWSIPGTGLWRMAFDVVPEGNKPIELTAWIEGFGQTLTEQWSYQWITT